MQGYSKDGKRERFIRWQGIRIQQLGAVNNMFVILATAIIAFELPFLFEKADEMSGAERWVFLVSLILFLASIMTGCYTAWNRLQDFRKTEWKVRLRGEVRHAEDERLGSLEEKIKALENETDRLGKTTWRLLHFQAILFALGVVSLVIAGSIFLFFQNQIPVAAPNSVHPNLNLPE